MADRSVKVRLDADVSGYQAKMRTAAQATVDFTKRANDAGGRALDWVGKHETSINTLSNGFLGAGAVLTGFAGIAVKSAADFDEAMSSVQAATMAPAAEMEQLRQAAIEAGASTKYSATEAAAAIEELAKAGVSTADILSGGLSGALDLAASDNIEVAQAAEIASSAMTQFGLAGEDVSHIADLLAAGAGKAQGGVADLGMALSQAGLVASQTGLSIEETVGGLTAFASAGLMGSDAGTSFKSMLQQLNNPSAKARREMDALGISMYDSQGEFIGLTALAGELETAMADLTPEQRNAAMAVIFGSDAVRAANVLYSEGEAGIREWISAVDDQGFAAEQASLRMDNLKGDLEELGGALETALIGAGTDANNGLRPLVQGITDVVNAFNQLPSNVQSALGYGTGILGLSLLALGGLGKLVVGINDARTAMQDLGIMAQLTGNKLKLLGAASVAGLAITGLVTILGGYIGQAAEADAASKNLADAFDRVTGAANENADMLLLEELNTQIDKADWSKLNELGYSYADFTDAIMGGSESMAAMREELHQRWLDAPLFSEERDALSEAIGALDTVGKGYQLTADQAKVLADQQDATGASTEEMAAQQEVLAGAIEETGVGLEGVVEDMEKFLELLFATGLATMSARDAQAAYHESINEVGDAVKEINEDLGGMGEALNESKTDFDLTTEAGRTANGAFQEIAKSGFDVVTSMSEAGASQDELQGKLSGTYDDLIAAAGQFGITGDAAEDLAREVLGIPDGVDIDTWMSDEAERQAKDTARAIDGIDRYINIVTQYTTRGTAPPVGNRGAPIPIAANADGNVWTAPGRVKAFADGSENHVAQIAAPGAMRLWAEPETGGEAYIPLAASKRARSERILADVANRFGMGLSKFDNGGMVLPYEPRRPSSTPARAGSTFAPTFHNYNTDAVRATREQVAQFGQAIDAMPVQLAGG